MKWWPQRLMQLPQEGLIVFLSPIPQNKEKPMHKQPELVSSQ